MNPEILARYAQNRLVVTRQVRFIDGGDESVDLVLFLNGFPIATAELKNPLTNQTVQDAVAQYRRRDPRHGLLRFKTRALVHFAVDPDRVYMATKLAGEGTFFLPFNRGSQGGAGNPDHPSGYRTGYLWQEVGQRDSFLDILGRFAHLAVEETKVEGKTVTKESIVYRSRESAQKSRKPATPWRRCCFRSSHCSGAQRRRRDERRRSGSASPPSDSARRFWSDRREQPERRPPCWRTTVGTSAT